MATESVNPSYLPSPLIEEAHKLLCQSQGIIELINSGGNNIQTDDSLPAVCWALREKLERLAQIVGAKAAGIGSQERS